MNVVIIEKTNNHHSYDNREILGVTESNAAFILFIRNYTEQNMYDELSDDDIYNLQHIKQTQNYTENFEFVLTEMYVNTIND